MGCDSNKIYCSKCLLFTQQYNKMLEHVYTFSIEEPQSSLHAKQRRLVIVRKWTVRMNLSSGAVHFSYMNMQEKYIGLSPEFRKLSVAFPD